MFRSTENKSDIYLRFFDNEAKEWFGRMERFIDNRKLMFSRNGIEKTVNINDLDDLFEDFKNDDTQLCSIEERVKRSYLTAKTLATVKAKEENGEIVITAKISKH